MVENKKEGGKGVILLVIIGLILIFILLMNLGLVKITVLDPTPLQNITLKLNIT